nr:hypothetical protein [Angustibacter aerolatus]
MLAAVNVVAADEADDARAQARRHAPHPCARHGAARCGRPRVHRRRDRRVPHHAAGPPGSPT